MLSSQDLSDDKCMGRAGPAMASLHRRNSLYPRFDALISTPLVLVLSLLLLVFCSFTKSATVETLHLLIPAGEGGGWDTTAREVGQALTKEGLVSRVYYENYIGAGGGRALMDLVHNPDRHLNTLMVQSTPLLLRHLTKTIEFGYRDVRPISIMIAEYQALVVLAESEFQSATALVEAIRQHPIRYPVIGGSAYGSLDHISFAMIAQAGNLPIEKIRYVASDGGGEALERLEKGFGVALISGIGEVIQAYRRGNVRILGITSPKRLPELPEVRTLSEQGLKVHFANWRGFFANADLPDAKVYQFKKVLADLNGTDYWQQILKKHIWSEFFLQGDELMNFLQAQEKDMREALNSLNIQ
ncbi:tripartite tricarboxylate transporter substrate binding protein [Hahella ganghwensis]|uniref:tripartite tricarboxylate transporter substrate binding protein n=1 Tax=Hahella ganghwensis TaxID=286420 RepID=UPI0003632A62|nr:tripartite tricarboxylate transporter substrate-binding protein [Hahella ganghwensis]